MSLRLRTLRRKVQRLKPEVVAFIGVSLYRAIAGVKGAIPLGLTRHLRWRPYRRPAESERPKRAFQLSRDAGRVSRTEAGCRLNQVHGSSWQTHAESRSACSLRTRDVGRPPSSASELRGQIVAVGIGVPARAAVGDRGVIPLGVRQNARRAAPGIDGEHDRVLVAHMKEA